MLTMACINTELTGTSLNGWLQKGVGNRGHALSLPTS
jgi:hypothetical protein